MSQGAWGNTCTIYIYVCISVQAMLKSGIEVLYCTCSVFELIVYAEGSQAIFSIPDPVWFLSSQKYDPGCSSRIRILTFYHSGSRGRKGTGSRIQASKRHRIPDPGVKKARDPGSGSPTLYRAIVFRAQRNIGLYLRVCRCTLLEQN